MTRETEVLDPPEPDAADMAGTAVTIPELVSDPTALIPIDRVLKACEGITGQDVAEAIVLEQQALSITVIDDDLVEEHVGDLIRELTAVDVRIEGKGRGWCDLAYKLHRGLTGLFGPNGQVRLHTQNGLKHLRPLLSARIEAKRRAEEQRVRVEREAGLRQDQDRLLDEARHVESTGGTKEEVDAIIEEAQTLPPPPVAARPITTARGASTRENWKCEVTSIIQLVIFIATHPEHINLLMVNTTAANQLAKAQKSGLKIPGLRAFNDPVLSTRRS